MDTKKSALKDIEAIARADRQRIIREELDAIERDIIYLIDDAQGVSQDLIDALSEPITIK